MKKIYTLLSFLALAVLPTFAQRETISNKEDFNPASGWEWGGHQYAIYQKYMPEGWYLAGLVITDSGRLALPTNNGYEPYTQIEGDNTVVYFYNVNGRTESWNDMDNLSYIVTLAKPGMVSFNFMATNRKYADTNPKFGFITLWEMEKNDEGLFVPVGQPLYNYPKLEDAGVTYDHWTTLNFDIDREMYIGLSAARVFVDDYDNDFVQDTYTVTGRITNPWKQEVGSAGIALERNGILMGEATADGDGYYTLRFSEPIYPAPQEDEIMPLADDNDYKIHVTNPWGYDNKRNVPVYFDNYAAEVNVELGQGTMTDISSIDAGETVTTRNGKLYVKGHADVFSPDGRCLRKVDSDDLTEVSGLPAGIYIVNGTKIIIGK